MTQGSQNSPRSAALSGRPAHPAWLVHLADYWTLTKPEVNFLVLVSTLVGFYLAAPGAIHGWLLFHTLMGTLLVASGTGTLNQYFERRTDAFMRRTANRPLPSGRLTHGEALWFGIFLSVAGGAELWIAANPLTSMLALATLGHVSDLLHAAQAPNAALHGGRSISRGHAAAHRMGRCPQRLERPGLGVVRHPVSYGNFPTSWRSPGCIERIMPGRDCRCCRAMITTGAPPCGRSSLAHLRYCQ